jgi:ParB/RepB/Spo0J family partition protein
MLKIQNKLVDELIEYDNNPRLNDEAVDVVAKSIKEFGFKVPVIIDANNVIVAGHTRVKACKRLGIKEVPCIVADDLTDDQLKAFRLADNKTHEFALWDDEKLYKELQAIKMDMFQFGFEDLNNLAENEKY